MVVEKSKRTYSVSQVTGLIRGALEAQLPARLIVRGEISGFKQYHSGHCYFSLKDEGGVLPCVMWSSRFHTVKFTPEDGMAILAHGNVDVYLPGGKYQFYADRLEPEGVGALQKAFEQMVAKLQAEGLFDEAHKQPLPAYPRRIAVLTSESGAALHDITDSVFDRWPVATLVVVHVPVQGEGAAQRIAAALQDLNHRNAQLQIDLAIVGRGGGSLEDLWAFNEECLARAIFSSRIPIISAVGHEVDVTVADMVADARASTPTKAGVVAVPDQAEVEEELGHYACRLTAHIRSRLDLNQAQLDTLLAREVFRRPELPIRQRQQLLDELLNQMIVPLQTTVGRAKDSLNRFRMQLQKIEPHRLLGRQWVVVNDLAAELKAKLEGGMARQRMVLENQANRLAALNPKSVLHRGYSITVNTKSGQLVRNQTNVKTGDVLRTELAGDNFIESQVTKV